MGGDAPDALRERAGRRLHRAGKGDQEGRRHVRLLRRADGQHRKRVELDRGGRDLDVLDVDMGRDRTSPITRIGDEVKSISELTTRKTVVDDLVIIG